MYNSTLKRKTPLRAKTALKSHSTLKAKKSLGRCTIEKHKALSSDKAKTPEKVYRKPYKPTYKYQSIFTEDLSRCFITECTEGFYDGRYYDIHKHHIFRAANKSHSEKYHFIIPLRDDWHNLSSYSVHKDKNLDLALKIICQEYFLEHYGTLDEFIAIFGKCWTAPSDEEFAELKDELSQKMVYRELLAG